jgi:predicted DNA-binding transcriptional regulator YafY
MRRADRLFQLILLMGRGRVVTAQTLAEKLEVSERTVYRDIQDLASSGVPIDGQAGVGYMLRSGYQVPPLMFNKEELEALAFGIQVTQTWADEALANAAQTAMSKIVAVLPQHLQQKLELRRLWVPAFHVPDELTETLGTLRAAIENGRKLWLRYGDMHSSMTERVIWPLGLVYWGAKWTLAAWCELRQGFRTFRIDRMHSVDTLSAEYPKEAGYQLSDYFAAVSGESE